MSEGRSTNGGAWPFVMLLGLVVARLGRRTQNPSPEGAMRPPSPRLQAILAGLAALLMAGVAAAQTPSEPPPASAETRSPSESDAIPSGPVNVALPEPPPPRRYAAIEWNPLPLLVMSTGTRNRIQTGRSREVSASSV